MLHGELEDEAAQFALAEPPDAARQCFVVNVCESALARVRAVRQERLDHETPEPLPGLLLLDLGDDQRESFPRCGGTKSPCFRLLLLLAAIVFWVLRHWALGDLERPPCGLEHLCRIVQRD